MTAASDTKLGDEKPPVFIRRIKLQNLLSFGPDTTDLELGPLNVLIGPNGSGKSNGCGSSSSAAQGASASGTARAT